MISLGETESSQVHKGSHDMYDVLDCFLEIWVKDLFIGEAKSLASTEKDMKSKLTA
jgi:hypothetical protein